MTRAQPYQKGCIQGMYVTAEFLLRSLINIHILVKFQSLITSLLSPQYIYHICDAIAIITYSKTQLTADLFVNLIPHLRHISFNTGMVKIGRLFISTSLFLIKSANT